MIGVWDDDYGQFLRLCLVQYVDQWYGVVLFVVDDDGVCWYWCDILV